MTTSTHRGIRLLNFTCQTSGREGGYSVTELVIVISILGVMSALTVGAMNQFLGGSKDALADARKEMLNQAVYRFAQQNYELQFNPISGSMSDEMVILRTLQYRDTNVNRAKIGSPYVDPRYNPVASSDDSLHRLRWTGKMFELLSPGTSGSGMLMNFEGTDFTTAFVFPPNFQTSGR